VPGLNYIQSSITRSSSRELNITRVNPRSNCPTSNVAIRVTYLAALFSLSHFDLVTAKTFESQSLRSSGTMRSRPACGYSFPVWFLLDPRERVRPLTKEWHGTIRTRSVSCCLSPLCTTSVIATSSLTRIISARLFGVAPRKTSRDLPPRSRHRVIRHHVAFIKFIEIFRKRHMLSLSLLSLPPSFSLSRT